MSPSSYQAALFRDLRVDGVAGFEPANIGTKSRGLTTWRYPIIYKKTPQKLAVTYISTREPDSIIGDEELDF